MAILPLFFYVFDIFTISEYFTAKVYTNGITIVSSMAKENLPIVSKAEWDDTPESVKVLVRQLSGILRVVVIE